MWMACCIAGWDFSSCCCPPRSCCHMSWLHCAPVLGCRYRTAVQKINGGVFLLRPCAAVEAHMLSLLDQHPKLRYTHGTAEQEFFGWYYRYTGATLPLEYNAQAEQSLVEGGLTGGCLAAGRVPGNTLASGGRMC